MNRQWWTVGVIVGLIALLIGAGWFARDRFLPIEVGSRAPEFAAVDLDGRPVKLSDLAGEVVLLNIWATWCPPCREEMPSMQRLHKKMGEDGVNIIAVSIDAPIGSRDLTGNVGGDVADFAKDLGLTFPIWHDPAGRIQQTYRTTGVPESFVIDRNGTIVKKVVGFSEWDSEANLDLFRRLLES
jgi:cytochrome c biogenesis protein CcmG, thiol:disulfide interchange protein DsbE